MPAFEYATCATRGARDYQEDMATVSALRGVAQAPGASQEEIGCSRLLAVLADGMGGHAGGALASRTVCESFQATFAGEEELYEARTADRLINALEASNAAVADQVAADPMLSGMGSTLIGVSFGPEGVDWVSVGDSPLFLFRRGEMALLNEDHSLAPELDRLAAIGRISVEAARNDPRRHMLRSAVTGDEIELVDVSHRPLALEAGDYIILASDGIHTLDKGEIERVIAAYAEDGAAAVASALIRAVEAVRDPHQDNTTVVAVRLLPETDG